MTTPSLITSSEAGLLLGRSAKTVLRMAHADVLIPSHRLPGPNGAYLFDRAEVESLAAQRKEGKK